MKTMKAGAVVLLGLVLAAPVWGHRLSGVDIRINSIGDPDDPLRCFLQVNVPDALLRESPRRSDRGLVWSMSLSYEDYVTTDTEYSYWRRRGSSPLYSSDPHSPRNRLGHHIRCIYGFDWNRQYRFTVTMRTRAYYPDDPPQIRFRQWHDHIFRATYTTPEEPGSEPEPPAPPPAPPEPEPPSPPPEPEPETPTPPTPPEPEPEVPEPDPPPEAPDHSHPVCDHLAIVPAMPRALSGDEGTPDHWLRITNPGAEGITFTVTGRNDAGAEFGTYRRELPAYRSVKVLMRDIEAAFDVSEPEGWWTLTVTGSGTQYTSATMKQGDARRFVPVKVPATCPSGAMPATR